MTESAIYWITRLDSMHMFFGTMTGLGVIGIIFGIAGMLMMREYGPKDEDYRLAKSVLKWSAPFAFLMLAINIFTPTTKEMVAIKVIPKVAASVENVSKEDVKSTVNFIRQMFNIKSPIVDVDNGVLDIKSTAQPKGKSK